MDVVGLSEIAGMVGVTRQVVSNWRSRSGDFPPPVVQLKAGPGFSRSAVLDWLQRHGKQGVAMAATAARSIAEVPGGFWSYVRADDEADGGRILTLARDVRTEYEMLTGETIQLFLDRDSIVWGDNWRNKVDVGLLSALFFIPVLTPRYFLSAECRRELRKFADQATSLGVNELLLPLLYVEVPGIRDETPADELMALVRSFNWVDWTDLRFEEPTSRAYRAGVSNLARRLVDANRVAERSRGMASQVDKVAHEEPEGTIDRIEKMEKAIQPYAESMTEYSKVLDEIKEVMAATGTEIAESDRKGVSFAAGRVVAARRLAVRMEDPVERLVKVSARATSNLHDVDSGMRALFEGLTEEAKADPDAREKACDFFGMVRTTAESSRDLVANMQTVLEGSSKLEKLSRDLRPVLRRMRQSVAMLIEAQELVADWVNMVDASPLDCSGAPARGVGGS